MIRILTQTQYDAICDIYTDQQNKIKELEAQIKEKDKEIDEQAQLIYGLQEDLASLKWNLNKLDPKIIDFPNSYSDHKVYNHYVDKFI